MEVILAILYLVFYYGGVVVLGSIAGTIGFFVGLFFALRHIFYALRNNLNFRRQCRITDEEPAVRSYFFGPGFRQLRHFFTDALHSLTRSSTEIAHAYDAALETFGSYSTFWRMVLWFFRTAARIGAWIAGGLLAIVFSALFGLILLIVTIVIFVIFSVIWLVDKIYLSLHKVRSDCPVCKNTIQTPHFLCPDCGKAHKHLMPGPYGILRHRCACGKKLPATFLNGRSRLEAVCPHCGAPLVATDARPVVFQLVGGIRAGKTVYLAAFFHEFLEILAANPSIEAEIPESYKPYFDNLERWYAGGECPATAQLNAQLYPVLIDRHERTRYQFAMYDIAGEMFDGMTAESQIAQKHFDYCDGLVLLIDPFCSGKLRENREASGEDLSTFSDMPAEDVIANFINYLVSIGSMKTSERSQIPLAVLIVKADMPEVAAAISDKLRENESAAQDEVCRQFLMDIGMTMAVDMLEAQFTNLHYFVTSAMGHHQDGTGYQPKGVMASMRWLMSQADADIHRMIFETATKDEGAA